MGCRQSAVASPALSPSTTPVRNTTPIKAQEAPRIVSGAPSLPTRKRKSIFESSEGELEDAQNANITISVLEDSTKFLLETSLAKYFGIQKDSPQYSKLNIFVHSMERHEFTGGTTILSEDQFSTKIYVIELGYVQISKKSQFLRTLGKGAVLGEMSLDDQELIPLTSTAHCITKAILWSLSKSELKRIEFKASSAMLLRGALQEYFGLNSTEQDKLDLFVNSMVREEIKSGTTLIVEGDVGSRLYVIESGYFQISVKGNFVRTIGTGKILGDLALLYDSPRSASAHAITDSVVWSLHRDSFRLINVQTSSNLFKKRAKWLINSPELGCLSSVNFTRLVNSFQTKEVREGATLYLSRTLCTDCILIESGRAVIYVPSEEPLVGMDPAQVDDYLGISRPPLVPKRKLTSELMEYFEGRPAPVPSSEDIEADIDSVYYSSPVIDAEDAGGITFDNGASAPNSRRGSYKAKPEGYMVCEVYEGCLLGTGALRQANDESNAWKCSNRTWKFSDGAWHALKSSYGVLAPFTVKATTPCKLCAFSFEAYDQLLEPPDSVEVSDVSEEVRSEPSMCVTTHSETLNPNKSLNYDISMFRAKYVLGKGSFAIVLSAELRSGEPVRSCYALKIYDKMDIVSRKQLKNVLKSVLLLRKMNSPFIMKLHGTFQTAHQLYLILEPLLHGCVWDLMTEPPFGKIGLPPQLVQFYTASIVLALAHIHSLGAGYRELKPENIMIDSKGYIRLIDFGMCKKIPFSKTDSSGCVKFYSKSYTLFGTPGTISIRVKVFTVYLSLLIIFR